MGQFLVYWICVCVCDALDENVFGDSMVSGWYVCERVFCLDAVNHTKNMQLNDGVNYRMF